MASTVEQPSEPERRSAINPSGFLRRLGRQTVYLLSGFPVALVAFTVLVTGFATGAGLLITVLGLPILTVTLLIARWFAYLERTRLVSLMDEASTPVIYLRAAPDDRWFKRMSVPLRDAQSWRDFAHGIVSFPITTITWSVAVTWWLAVIGGLSWPMWGWLLPDDPDNQDLPELLGLGNGYGTRAAFYLVCGAVAAATLPWVIAMSAKSQAAVSSELLVASSRRSLEIEHLVEGREATRAAERSSLRRLERDIHDGPQQRLVRLSMDLGRAQKKATGSSPELAAALDDARRQTQDTLDELRALSRGIAPPILTDRGLQRALEELAVRSAIPVACEVELGDAVLSEHVESTVYFVATEALTNAAKHSGTEHVDLRVTADSSTVTVQVTDHGVGGAHRSERHGLAGLDNRLRAVDGVLRIDSPAGGPTTITAKMPCG